MRSDEERLRDIVEHADLIGAHLPASRDVLDADVVLAAALVRWVGVVGEAAARLSDPFRRSHPEIPWAEIAGMRNHLVHGYFAVDADLLWVAVTVEIPGLARDGPFVVGRLTVLAGSRAACRPRDVTHRRCRSLG